MRVPPEPRSVLPSVLDIAVERVVRGVPVERSREWVVIPGDLLVIAVGDALVRPSHPAGVYVDVARGG